MPVYRLPEENIFPHPDLAEKNGLLAIGGDLSSERLLLAYENGIFPWYNEDEPILWWTPDPRCVLFPKEIKISKSMRKVLRSGTFNVTYDKDFEKVINMCRKTREDFTWLSKDMVFAYLKLFELGFAHSVEVWNSGNLVGGLYGVALGKCFFGESMFSTMSNSSKVAMIDLAGYLDKNNYELVDCQVYSEHLISMGARNITRGEFLEILDKNVYKETTVGKWNKNEV